MRKKSFFSKVWKRRSDFRSIFASIYFNFHYLPIKQAIKLPILLYKPKFKNLKGKIIFDCPKLRYGMVKLGFEKVSIYPNAGITIENKGGTITFKGDCCIGNNSFLSIGEYGKLCFGDQFESSSIKIISYRSIYFGYQTSIGWDSIVMDTNLHPLKRVRTGIKTKMSGPIVIGDYNWFGNRCTIMHSVRTPERCVFSLNSIVTSGIKYVPYCIHGGFPVKVLFKGVYRDYEDNIDIDLEKSKKNNIQVAFSKFNEN